MSVEIQKNGIELGVMVEDEALKKNVAKMEVASSVASPFEKIEKEKVDVPSSPRIITKKSGFKYGCYLFLKRVFDVVSASLLLIVLSPFIAVFLLIKWLEDFHNPVYVSTRVGKDGKEFKFFKIRTMCVDADKKKDGLINDGLNETDGPVFKMKKDPRITKVGRFYRKWSIDELLQLINVINGTMSVVGPRPPLPREVAEYTEEQRQRLMVKGGLLCLWQIQKNRHDLKFEEWVNLDLDYIENQSVWLDLKIIFKGLFMVIFDRTGE